MKTALKLVLLLQLVVLAGVWAASAQGQNSTSQDTTAQDTASQAVTSESVTSEIRAEIARLQQSLKAEPITDPDMAFANKSVEDTLKAAAAELDAGRVYVSLEDLGSAEDLLPGARAMQNDAVATGGLPAFQAVWEKASVRLTALDKQSREHDWNNSRAAIRALSETAQRRTLPLLEGGQGFATATQPKDGLLYIGEAEGQAAFAAFCTSLSLTRTTEPVALRSLLPELQKLQDKTNAAFQPPRSIELHTRFIALNSTIKLAEELDSSKLYAGALYEYLEAVRHYGMLETPPVAEADQTSLKKSLGVMQKQLAASARDDSIAQLFVERAQSYISHVDGSVPSADEWRAAEIILHQVLPAYLEALKPASPLQAPSGKTVDITLVRWPYT